MKKILAGLAATILMTGVALADEVAVSTNQSGDGSWVVIDDDIYLCSVRGNVDTAVCVKAKKVNSQ